MVRDRSCSRSPQRMRAQERAGIRRGMANQAWLEASPLAKQTLAGCFTVMRRAQAAPSLLPDTHQYMRGTTELIESNGRCEPTATALP